MSAASPGTSDALERTRRLGLWALRDADGLPDWIGQTALARTPLAGESLPSGHTCGWSSNGWLVLRAPCDANGLLYAAAWTGEGVAPHEAGDDIEHYSASLAERTILELSRTLVELRIVQAASNHIELFTSELDQAYETLSLIYRMGRASALVEDPLDYVRTGLDELRGLMDYRWACVVLSDDERKLGQLAGRQWWCDSIDDGGAALAALTGYLQRPDIENISGVVLCDEPRLAPEFVLQPVTANGSRMGWLVLGEKLPSGTGPATSSDSQAAEAVAGCVSNVVESIRLRQDQERTFVGTLLALSRALDAKDRYTRGHSERVAWLATELATQAGLGEAFAANVHLAGVLHDIGKIGVPDAVLCKPGRLTDDEFDAIRQHPRIGHEILKGIPAVEGALAGVLHHHERYDGRGYPEGLAGEDIPVIARVLALADTFDAMSSDRAYRAARTREQVLDEIAKCAGSQFDPALAEVFVRLDFAGFDALVDKHRDEQAYVQRSIGEAA